MRIRGYHRCLVFFFQAEDGIRDADVTGVQTCALPISHGRSGEGAGDHEGVEQRTADRRVKVNDRPVVAESGPWCARPVVDVELRQLLEADRDANEHRHQVDQKLEGQRGKQEKIGQAATADPVSEARLAWSLAPPHAPPAGTPLYRRRVLGRGGCHQWPQPCICCWALASCCSTIAVVTWCPAAAMANRFFIAVPTSVSHCVPSRPFASPRGRVLRPLVTTIAPEHAPP